MKGNKIGEGIGGTNHHTARCKFLYCLPTVYFRPELPAPMLLDIGHCLGTHHPTPSLTPPFHSRCPGHAERTGEQWVGERGRMMSPCV